MRIIKKAYSFMKICCLLLMLFLSTNNCSSTSDFTEENQNLRQENQKLKAEVNFLRNRLEEMNSSGKEEQTEKNTKPTSPPKDKFSKQPKFKM